MRPSRRAAVDASSVLHIPPRERPSPSCSHCWRHLATDPAFIVCAHGVCKSRIICVDCFLVGAADEYPHCVDHPYRVVEQVEAPLFEPDWSADDEMLLINALCEYGPYHWKAIAERVGKSQEKCERHYEDVYLTGENAPIPTSFLPSPSAPQSSGIPAISPGPGARDNPFPVSYNAQTVSEHPALTRAVAASPPLPLAATPPDAESSVMITPDAHANPVPNTVILPHQSDTDNEDNDSDSILTDKITPDPSYGNDTNIEGFMPRRADLEIEYDDDAEDAIADIVIGDNDTEEEKQLKFQLLQIYDKRLTRRDRIKQFIFQRDLIHVDKVKVGDRRHTRDEKELLARLQVFTRLLPKKEFIAFRDAIMREFRHSREIYRLQQFRAVGIKRRAEIDVYELERRARASLLAKGKVVDWPPPILCANPTLSQCHPSAPGTATKTKRRGIYSVKRRRTTKLPSPSPSPNDMTPSSIVARSLSASPVLRPSPLHPNLEFSAPLPQNHPTDGLQFHTVQFSYSVPRDDLNYTGIVPSVTGGASTIPESGEKSFPLENTANISPNVPSSGVDAASSRTAGDAVLCEDEARVANIFLTNSNVRTYSNNKACQSSTDCVEGRFRNAGTSAVFNCPEKAANVWNPSLINERQNCETAPTNINPLPTEFHTDRFSSDPGPAMQADVAPTRQVRPNVKSVGDGINVAREGPEDDRKVGDISNENRDSRERVPRSSSTRLRRERQHQRLLRSPYPQLRPMSLNGNPDIWKLTLTEQKLCSVLHIEPSDFLRQRDAMLNQARRQLQMDNGQPFSERDSMLKLRCGYLPPATRRMSNLPSEDGTENLPSRGTSPNHLLQCHGELTATTLQTGNRNLTVEDGLRANGSEEVDLFRSRGSDDRAHTSTDCAGAEAPRIGIKGVTGADMVGEGRCGDVVDVTAGSSGSANIPTTTNSGDVVRRISVFVDATIPSEEDGNTYSNIVEVRTITPQSVKLRRNASTQCIPKDLDVAFASMTPWDYTGFEISSTFEGSNFGNRGAELKLEEVAPHPSPKLLPLSSDDGHHSSERGSSSYVGRFLSELGANAKIMIEVDTRGAGPSGGSADSIGDRLREAFGNVSCVVDGEESSPLNGVGTECGEKETEGIEDHHNNSFGTERMKYERDIKEFAVISQWRPINSLKIHSTCPGVLTTVGESIIGGMTQAFELGGNHIIALSTGEVDKPNASPLLEAKVGVRMVQVLKPEHDIGQSVLRPEIIGIKGRKTKDVLRPARSRKRPRPQQYSHTGPDVKRKRRTKRIVLSEEEDDAAAATAEELVDEEILEEGRANVSDVPVKLAHKPTKRRIGRPRGRGRGTGKRGRGKVIESTSQADNLNQNIYASVQEESGSQKYDVDGPSLRQAQKVLLRLRLKAPEESNNRRRRIQTQTKASLVPGDDNKKDRRRLRAKHAVVNATRQEMGCLESPRVLASSPSITCDAEEVQGMSGKESFLKNSEIHCDDVDGGVGAKSKLLSGKGISAEKGQLVQKVRKEFTPTPFENEMVLLIPKESAPSKSHTELPFGANVAMNALDEGREPVHCITEFGPSKVSKGRKGDNKLQVAYSEPCTSVANKNQPAQGIRSRGVREDVSNSDCGDNEGNDIDSKQALTGPPMGVGNGAGSDEVEPSGRLSDEKVVWIEPSDAISGPIRPSRHTTGARGAGRRGRKPASVSGRGGRGRGSNNGQGDGSTGSRGRVSTRSRGERYSLRRKM